MTTRGLAKRRMIVHRALHGLSAGGKIADVGVAQDLRGVGFITQARDGGWILTDLGCRTRDHLGPLVGAPGGKPQ